ncbi:hypothetical protein [Glaciihabitans sp. UYNi722]|uniref:hypothetical protein n=1 Tax=Glaciihabitans sp. UYNi722 TaxID=3156344 RepID=UPI0033993B59
MKRSRDIVVVTVFGAYTSVDSRPFTTAPGEATRSPMADAASSRFSGGFNANPP